MPLLTQAAYAKHRGVSRQAVFQAVRDGRIPVSRGADGAVMIDPSVADHAWEVNTAHEKRRNTADLRPGESASTSGMEVPEPDVDGEGSDLTYANARAKNEWYKAEKARLEFEEKLGSLVAAEDVKEEWTQVATNVRTKVLGIPSKCRQRIADLSAEQYLAIEEIVRESLEDLSAEGDA